MELQRNGPAVCPGADLVEQPAVYFQVMSNVAVGKDKAAPLCTNAAVRRHSKETLAGGAAGNAASVRSCLLSVRPL